MLRVTLRGIRAHKLRFVATMLAVLLGVGFMISTQVLGATLKRTFDEVFTDVYANIDGVVRSSREVLSPFGPQRTPIDATEADALLAVPGVAAAEGQVQGFLTIIGPDGEPTANANAGPPTFGFNWLTSPELNGWAIDEGRAPEGPGEVVVDRNTADGAGFAVGDVVTIDLPSGVQQLALVGVATFGDFDDYGGAPAALFDTATAQALLGEPGKVDYLAVAAVDGVTQAELVDELAPVLPDGTEVITGAAFTDESAGPFREFISDFTRFISLFGVIALFVGGFIIYNTFTVIVAQRTRELALLRAIGAGRRQVLGSVIGEAAIVGVVSSAVGVGGGIVLAEGLRALLAAIGLEFPSSPLVLQPGAWVWPVGLAIAVTLVSALLPAWRASRVPPIAALTDVAVDRSGRSVVRLVLGVLLALVAAWVFVDGLDRTGEAALIRVGGSLLLTFLATVAIGPLYARPLATLLGAPLTRLVGITGRLARDNARRNPARTATTAAALTISVGLVTVIAIAASSATASVNRATAQTLISDLVIGAESFQGVSPQLADDLAALPEVAVATGLRAGPAEVLAGGEIIIGVDPVPFDELFQLDVTAGAMAELTDDGVAISSDLARDAGLGLGDTLVIRFVSTGQRPFVVQAVFTETPVLGRSDVLITQGAFDAAFPASGQADRQVLVELVDGVDPVAARAEVERVADAYPTAQVQDLEEVQAGQAEQVNQAVTFLYALLFITVLIALIGVVNTLLLAVYERTRELGLLRAVGTLRRQLAGTILQESVIIALVGTVLGLAIGIAFGWALVRALASGEEDFELLFALPTSTIVVVVVGAIASGVLAGVYPAFRAGRLDVLDAIATE